MAQLTVTAKGQVTLRKDLLRHLGVAPGQKVRVDKLPNGRIEVRAEPSGRIQDFFGFLHRPDGPCLTIDEINEAIAAGWAGER
jgi:bifunctional DNA-binding transcriptional regulator/antitoxin component of YhaV-PrlF toxin-antitoxin module